MSEDLSVRVYGADVSLFKELITLSSTHKSFASQKISCLVARVRLENNFTLGVRSWNTIVTDIPRLSILCIHLVRLSGRDTEDAHGVGEPA